jgi:hypothetical protein
MPAPSFEISLPPGFEIIEEPSLLGSGPGGLYAALLADERNREGVVLARQTRAGVIRSLIVFSSEAPRLSEFLSSRFSSAR